jgi:hypothetical protein
MRSDRVLLPADDEAAGDSRLRGGRGARHQLGGALVNWFATLLVAPRAAAVSDSHPDLARWWSFRRFQPRSRASTIWSAHSSARANRDSASASGLTDFPDADIGEPDERTAASCRMRRVSTGNTATTPSISTDRADGTLANRCGWDTAQAGQPLNQLLRKARQVGGRRFSPSATSRHWRIRATWSRSIRIRSCAHARP